MTAERVYQLRALPDQKIPRPKQHGARLLSLGLNRDKAHRRSTGSLSDRFRVGGIVLLALDERFDVDGWDQSNLMPEIPDGSPPVVRTPAGFQGDDAARLLGKGAENFFSGKLFAEPNAAVGKSAMRLEGPLGKIETDNANLLHGCPLRSWDAKTSPPWHIAMPSGGASTPSLIALPGLVHLRVAALLFVLGRGRSGDDRGVDNRPLPHQQAALLQHRVDFLEQSLGQIVPLQPMPEMQHRGRVGDRVAVQHDPGKAAQCL